MTKGVRIKKFVQTGLILLFALLVGCAVLPGSTGTPAGLPVSSGAPGAIQSPVAESTDWVTSVNSVCIQVEQTYAGISGHSEPIAEELQGILSRMGVEATIGEGAGCEAVLSVTLQFTPYAEEVTGFGSDCYLDAELTGEATLSAEGYRTITLSRKSTRSTGDGVGLSYVSECPTQPDQTPFEWVWSWFVTQMLQTWWGTPAMVSALRADTAALRGAATNQLTYTDPEASGAIPVLAEMLGDADPQTRAVAARALGAFGPSAAEAVPALIEAIIDSDPDVRYGVIDALGEMSDSRAVPALITALHHSDSLTRYVAAQALEKMGPKAAPAIPDLIDAIDDEDFKVGWAAVDALGGIGPAADEAIPVLIELLENETWSSTYIRPARALESITGRDFGEDAAAWRQWLASQP